MEQLVLAGIIVVFVGIFLIIIGSLLTNEGEKKFAVGGFIGPIPFGFASEKSMLYIVIAIALVMFIIFILLGHR